MVILQRECVHLISVEAVCSTSVNSRSNRVVIFFILPLEVLVDQVVCQLLDCVVFRFLQGFKMIDTSVLFNQQRYLNEINRYQLEMSYIDSSRDCLQGTDLGIQQGTAHLGRCMQASADIVKEWEGDVMVSLICQFIQLWFL